MDSHRTMQAIWNGTVVAESDDTIMAEGNHYFPQTSLRVGHFTPSATRALCPWKGVASYSITVDGLTNPDAAWQYRHPLPFARRLKGWVAFWHGVHVVPARDQDRADR